LYFVDVVEGRATTTRTLNTRDEMTCLNKGGQPYGPS
jgi:hypothetical protein